MHNSTTTATGSRDPKWQEKQKTGNPATHAIDTMPYQKIYNSFILVV